MDCYYIRVKSPNKAKNDIDEAFRELGLKNLSLCVNEGNAVLRFLVRCFGVLNILLLMKRGDALFLQYPMKKFYGCACIFAHFRGAKVVTVIHDLGAFRRHKLTLEEENHRLNRSDVLIVHNGVMRNHVVKHGYKGDVIELGIFDYRSEAVAQTYDCPHSPWRVVFAGGLSTRRNKFLYSLDGVMNNWEMDLYGPLYEDQAQGNSRITYHGCLPEDQLLAQVEADFGLVWDGFSIDECNGDWGEYLKINAPHKTSCYLRAGIPVIVWEKAAMKDFIVKHNLGFAVSSLRDIDGVLSRLTVADYQAMKKTAMKYGALLNLCHFITTSYHKAIEILKSRVKA